MLKFTITTLLLIILPGAFSQSLNSPESVEYDAVNNRWFISNNGADELLTRDDQGALSVFASGFVAGPHGLEIVGDTIFACDGSSVKGFDLNSGSMVMNLNLGATFLNGITHDNNNLYITDFSAKKIYRVNHRTGQYNVFVNGLTKSPNGIVFDEGNNRLVFVNWGSNAPIMAVNLADSSTFTLTTTSLGNCDGITMNCQGQFFVSSWTPARISLFENDFSGTPVNLNTPGLSSPADIFFAQETDTLGVPNSGNSTVGLHNYGSCQNTGINELNEASFQLLSNPGNQIQISCSDIQPSDKIFIYSIDGSLIESFNLTKQLTQLDLPNGSYMVIFERGGSRISKKAIIAE